MLMAAVITGYANKPQPIDDFETIGQSFYADFEETKQAKSLVVTSIDPDAIKEQRFEIKQIDGLWQIPSHEGYPAEAAERLAKTAASLVGLTRDSLVGRRTSDYEKFGVVDPRSEDLVDIESVGQSITLRDANEDVLVDFIIGNRADEPVDGALMGQEEPQSYYYVRRADETNVYRIPLNIELSTKFSDWIEPDLLQVEASDVVTLDLNNYEIQERSSGMFGQVKELLKVQGDQVSLTRKSSTDDWEMAKIDPENERVKQAAVDAIVSVLDEMAIVDVKKKPTLDGKILLDADLNYSVTPAQAKLMSITTQQQLDALSPNEQAEFQALQMGIMELQRDLEAKGFSFGSTGEKMELVSAGGEMQAGTSGGLRYTLHIGKAPTDTVEEIKVAGASDESSDEEEEAQDSESEDGAESNDAGEEKEQSTGGSGNSVSEDAVDKDAGDEDEASQGENRYVLIRVAFDESLLNDPGEKPVEPVAPTIPDGYTKASSESADDAESSTSEGEEPISGDDGEDAVGEESDEDEAAPKPDNMERNPAFVKYDEDFAAYETAKVDYEVALSTYQSALAEKESQTKLGKKKAELLNGRFEKWYYIVSADNLKTLQSDRAELLDPVITTTPEEEAAANAAAEAKAEAMKERPDVSFPEIGTEQMEQTNEGNSGQTEEVEKPAVNAPTEQPAPESTPEPAAEETNEGEAASDGGTSEVEPMETEATLDEASPKNPAKPEAVTEESFQSPDQPSAESDPTPNPNKADEE